MGVDSRESIGSEDTARSGNRKGAEAETGKSSDIIGLNGYLQSIHKLRLENHFRSIAVGRIPGA